MASSISTQVSGGAVDVIHLSDRATRALTRVQATGWSTTIMDETYSYDVWGRRTERHDMRTDAYENYGYDDNNRLTGATATFTDHTSATTLAASYDDAGNFVSKTNRAGTIGYTYAAGNADQLASVSGHLAGAFGYDNAGRITTGPDGLSASYNTRGLAAVLHKKGHTAELAYAPDGHRYRSILDSTQTVTYLAGGAFKIIQKDGVTTYRQAVIVGGVMVAQLTTRSNATHEFHYFYHDVLGSIVAVTGKSGSDVITRLAYGPFGKVRAAGDWSSLLGPSAIEALNLPTRQGYTGGEALTALGLVHLGARIYDPALGRWLSPDPAGASVPYVYVGDNPLGDTDPSGQMSLGQILVIAALVMASVFTMGAMLTVLGSYVLAGMATGAIMGFASGMIASDGNLHAGLMGALAGAAAGAAFGYLGGLNYAGGMLEKAAVEGFAGGALSSVEGGSFRDGFIGTFVSSMAGDFIKARIPGKGQGAIMERTAAAAALGGTASRLTGGSFANGAISAAFQHLFNHALHNMGMFRTKGRSIDGMKAYAHKRNIQKKVKATSTCARRTWGARADANTPAALKWFTNGDPMRWVLNSDPSHAYLHVGLDVANHSAQVFSEASIVRNSASWGARAARWAMPKVSLVTGGLSKISAVWSLGAMAVDIPILSYSAYQVVTDPATQCSWGPH